MVKLQGMLRTASAAEDDTLASWCEQAFTVCRDWIDKRGLVCPRSILVSIGLRAREWRDASNHRATPKIFELAVSPASLQASDIRYQACFNQLMGDLAEDQYAVTLQRMGLDRLDVAISGRSLVSLYDPSRKFLYIPSWILQLDLTCLCTDAKEFVMPMGVTTAWLLTDALVLNEAISKSRVTDIFRFY
jgi:hypothetical protein